MNLDFETAQSRVSSSRNIPQNILLKLYGLFKVATIGPCSTSKPSFYNFKEVAKWTSWSECSSLSKADAMNQYIELANEYCSSETEPLKQEFMVSVSKLEMQETQEIPSILAAARDADMIALNANTSSINSTDGNGMTALFYAVDRGHVDVVEYLLQRGINVNHTDDLGMTALHVAKQNGDRVSWELLVRHGGDVNIKDLDGEDAVF